jgi:polysaccharide deacetylase family protein (PEP-CTERM system associated)
MNDMGLNVGAGCGFGKQLQEIPLSGATNLLSVDLENWQGTSCRDEALYLLELFRKRNTKATFFVHSGVAEEDSDLLRQIDVEGHEIASHGCRHRSLFDMTVEEFRADVEKSITLLSEVVDKPVLGYRAPIFSIAEENYWALDILVELGIKYDSSIFPIAGARYGVPDFPRGPVQIQRSGGSIIEVPLSTVRWLGRNWPVSGGGYFRLLPYSFISRAVEVVNQDGFPFVVYCHPYEFCQETLRCTRDASSLGWWKTRKKEIKTNMFRKSMRSKLSRLLERFRFCSFAEALDNEIRA